VSVSSKHKEYLNIRKPSLNRLRLNYVVRDPISFVGGPWRTMADLVGGCVVIMLYRYLYEIRTIK